MEIPEYYIEGAPYCPYDKLSIKSKENKKHKHPPPSSYPLVFTPNHNTKGYKKQIVIDFIAFFDLFQFAIF